MKARKNIIEIIAALLALLWVYAAVSKWIDYHALLRSLGEVPWFGKFAGILSIVMPLGELIVACLVLSNRWKKLGFILSGTLLLIFSGYIVYVLNFSAKTICPCGGILTGLTWLPHLIFNASFFILTVIGIVLLFKNRARVQQSPIIDDPLQKISPLSR